MDFLFSETQELSPEDYAVTFFNVSDVSMVRYAGKLLEPPLSVPIQLVRTDSYTIRSGIVEASERNYSGYSLGGLQSESPSAYQEIFSKSRTVVIPDSFFETDSMLDETVGFHQRGGKEALIDFYKKGGTVIVMCVEGIYAIGSLLNTLFGCEWNFCGTDHETCVPTKLGIELLGTEIAKSVYARKGHFMVVPEGEVLYQVEVLSLEDFAMEHCSVDLANEEEDEEEVQEAKEEYERYKKNNSSKSLLALHRNESGGRLIWMGDRNEEDPKMRAIFAQLCHG